MLIYYCELAIDKENANDHWESDHWSIECLFSARFPKRPSKPCTSFNATHLCSPLFLLICHIWTLMTNKWSMFRMPFSTTRWARWHGNGPDATKYRLICLDLGRCWSFEQFNHRCRCTSAGHEDLLSTCEPQTPWSSDFSCNISIQTLRKINVGYNHIGIAGISALTQELRNNTVRL